MVANNVQTGLAQEQGECASDAQLRDVLASDGASESQSAIVRHLDTCNTCQRRLTAIASDERFESRARACLQSDKADRADTEVLQAKLATWCDLESTTSESPSDDLSLAFLKPSDDAAALGRIGRYEVMEVLGRGGMGLVLKAHDPVLQRSVAIKVMSSAMAMHPRARDRFRREARAAAAVHNEHTVAVYEVNEEGDVPFLVMEYIQGCSVQDLLDRGKPLPIDDVLRIGAHVARGLAAAHAQGLIHRDVKPANILLDEQTKAAKISDFGLARAIDDSSLTQQGSLAGTPEYMSPEQAGCESVGSETDLFSLGSVLYSMCAGKPPFQSETSLGVLRMIREDSPQALAEVRPETPRGLVEIIEQLMSKTPEGRRYSARDLAEALQRVSRYPSDDSTKPVSPKQPQATGMPKLAWIATLSLAIVIGIVTVGETAGLWKLMMPVVAALNVGGDGESDPAESEVADEEAANNGGAAVAKDGEKPDAPTRVQVLPRNALLKEAIQKEKDQLDEEPSPLLVRKLLGHEGPVTGLAYTPDGKQIASCSGWPTGDRTLRLWDAATGEVLRKFDTSGMPKDPGISGPREAPGELYALALSPHGDYIVTGATGGATTVWNVTTGELVRNVEGHLATVYGAAVAPDGRRALTGGRDSTARLWKVETGELIYELKGNRSWVRCVAISPDGNWGLTGGYDGTLRLWDLETGKQLKEMGGGDNWVWRCAFSPDGKTAAVAQGAAIVLWDLETGKQRRKFSGHNGRVTCIAFSPDGRQLASSSYDHTVRLWHVATGRQEEVYLGHRDWVWEVTFSPDGRQLASAGGGREDPVEGTSPGIDFAIRLWKVP